MFSYAFCDTVKIYVGKVKKLQLPNFTTCNRYTQQPLINRKRNALFLSYTSRDVLKCVLHRVGLLCKFTKLVFYFVYDRWLP